MVAELLRASASRVAFCLRGQTRGADRQRSEHASGEKASTRTLSAWCCSAQGLTLMR